MIIRTGKSIRWKRNSPVVAEALPVDMEMRARHIEIIRVTMRWPAKIKAGQNHNVACPILTGSP